MATDGIALEVQGGTSYAGLKFLQNMGIKIIAME